MNRKPIGIFDSGVGGLTVAKAIMKLMPQETIYYLGDTANLPYGEKSEEIIKSYAVANTEFLLRFGIKVLVVACNTASSVALDYLKSHFRIPIIGVIEPAAKGAVYASNSHKVGVIGTNRTIKSNVYAEVIKRLDPESETFSRACPLFVPLIEEDFISHQATRLIAQEYLKDFKKNGIDSMILGCTHYPLIRDIIAEVLPNVKLIDSASSTARDLQSVLSTSNMLYPQEDSGEHVPQHRFFATDITAKLNALANKILEMEVGFEEVTLKIRRLK